MDCLNLVVYVSNGYIFNSFQHKEQQQQYSDIQRTSPIFRYSENNTKIQGAGAHAHAPASQPPRARASRPPLAHTLAAGAPAARAQARTRRSHTPLTPAARAHARRRCRTRNRSPISLPLLSHLPAPSARATVAGGGGRIWPQIHRPHLPALSLQSLSLSLNRKNQSVPQQRRAPRGSGVAVFSSPTSPDQRGSELAKGQLCLDVLAPSSKYGQCVAIRVDV